MSKDELDKDAKFAADAKALFDESVDSLDASRLSQLNQARNRALEELERGTGVANWQRQWLLPAGGAVAAAALVAVLVSGPDDGAIDLPLAPSTAETDFELLINEDNLEMLEDLEFYSWLTLDDLEDIDASELES